MKVVFLGVGEAFDEEVPNVSLLVESETGKTRMLLDCGFTVPYQLWRYAQDPNYVNGIYVSHFHADHTFGIPALVARMGEDERKQPLVVLGQRGTKRYVSNLIECAFPSLLKNLGYTVGFREISRSLQFGEFNLTFAVTLHSISCLAVRVSDGQSSVSYSGDGHPTPSAQKLYYESDLLVHEAYTEKERIDEHATMAEVLTIARTARVGKIALVHRRRSFRKGRASLVADLGPSHLQILTPKAFDEVVL
jgi:ribonuclease Z